MSKNTKQLNVRISPLHLLMLKSLKEHGVKAGDLVRNAIEFYFQYLNNLKK
jgi:hypothetical protein